MNLKVIGGIAAFVCSLIAGSITYHFGYPPEGSVIHSWSLHERHILPEDYSSDQ